MRVAVRSAWRIIAIAVVVVGVIAAWLTGTPAEPRTPDGLEVWLARWEVVRSCLIPTDLGDPAANVAIGELTGTPSCTRGLRELAKSPVLPEHDEIAKHWNAAIDAVERLDEMHAPDDRAALLASLERDAMYLRARVGMPMAVHRAEVLSVLASCELEIDGTVARSDSDLQLWFNAGQLRGRRRAGAGIATLCAADARRGAATPTRFAFGGPAPRSWSVETEEPAERRRARTTELFVKELAAGGATGPAQRISVPGQRSLVRWLGHGANRQIVLGPDWNVAADAGYPYVVVASTDGGRTWSLSYGPPGASIVLYPFLGESSLELVVRDDEELTLHRFTADAPTPAVIKIDQRLLPNYWLHEFHELCSHDSVAWGVTRGAVQRIDAAGVFNLELHDDGLWADQLDCHGDTAIALRRAPDVVERCRGSACAVVLELAHHGAGSVAFVGDGSWIYAAELDGVVGIWREHAIGPEFYRDPGERSLKAITTINDKPYLVLVGKDHVYRFAPVPPRSSKRQGRAIR
jgi:hypothetical protein